VIDCELQVKILWESTKDESLKSSKPEQPKQLGVIDLGWTGVTRS
jgi:hypothetical protein